MVGGRVKKDKAYSSGDLFGVDKNGKSLYDQLSSNKSEGVTSNWWDNLFGRTTTTSRTRPTADTANPAPADSLLYQTPGKTALNKMFQDALPKLAANRVEEDPFANYSDPYAGLRSSLQARSGADLATLKSIYDAAANYIQGMQGGVNTAFTNAAGSYNQANQAAANAVTAGYGASRAQQAAAFKALGIEDAANVILARGEDMSKNQTATTDALARVLQTNLDRNTSSQNLALQNLLLSAQAVQGEGARSQAAYSRALADKIAELEAQSLSSKNQFLSDQAKQRQAAAQMASDEAIAANKAAASAPATPEATAQRYAGLVAQAKTLLGMDDAAAQEWAANQM